jgi:creatinine amidohydrolase
MRPYILAETNWKTVKDTEYEVAILPWGATEAHNLHLPYATDVIEADYIAGESAKIAWEKGGKIIVLPAIPYGVNTGQHDVKLDMNINPGTQLIILKDLIEVLNRQGIYKLVILNSHGGNDFKQMIRELNLVFPEMFICQCHWFKIPGADHIFDDLGEHAGEVETSIMQYISPTLILPVEEAGEGKAKSFKITALKEGWAWAEREWTKVTDDTGIGNPAMATPEKGEKFLEFINDKIGNFLYDLSVADKEDLYE